MSQDLWSYGISQRRKLPALESNGMNRLSATLEMMSCRNGTRPPCEGYTLNPTLCSHPDK